MPKKATKKRRRFTCELKVRLIMELASGKSRAQLAREYEVDESQISKWQAAYHKAGEDAFKRKKKKSKEAEQIAELQKMIGRLHMENDILKQASTILGDKLSQLRKSRSLT